MLAAISDWWEELKSRSVPLRDWLELHSRWSQLGSLGNSNLVKASVLMPAFGYMLLLNDNVHQYLTIKYDGWLLNYLPSVWRIWLLFYGSFLLALATVLYGTFCHPDLKRYGTPYEKADAESAHIQRLGGLRGTADELKEEYAELTEREDDIFTLKRLDLNNLGNDAPAQLRTISKCLVHSYLIRNLKRPRLRTFIYVLFRLGIALIALPAIFTFIQVSAIATKRLFS
jgi:hypothetical protein